MSSMDGPAQVARRAQVAPPARLWGLPSWLLSHTTARSARIVLEHLGSANGRADYAVLAGLDELGPVSQAVLGRRVGLDRSDVVAFLNRLEREGLVRRSRDQRDPRRNSVTITRAGVRALHRLDGQVQAAQDVLLQPLSAAERTQLTALLQRLVEHHTGFTHPAPELEPARASSAQGG